MLRAKDAQPDHGRDSAALLRGWPYVLHRGCFYPMRCYRFFSCGALQQKEGTYILDSPAANLEAREPKLFLAEIVISDRAAGVIHDEYLAAAVAAPTV